ncbi:MAG: conjugal transfer protein TrbI [Synechococcus sp. ChSW.bin.154]
MTATLVKCACPGCTCEVSSSSAISSNGQSFCSDACASGHSNNEPCHDAAGACGCTCGS